MMTHGMPEPSERALTEPEMAPPLAMAAQQEKHSTARRIRAGLGLKLSVADTMAVSASEIDRPNKVPKEPKRLPCHYLTCL
jgi:hypothetical protein